MLKVTHNAGFFSCCTIKIYSIIQYFNSHKILPIVVDSSEQFRDYKIASDGDITPIFFQEQEFDILYTQPINFHWDDQFLEYRNLPLSTLKPFVMKYFSPSINVEEKINELITKHNINFDQTCAVMYRGNDKVTETPRPTYDQVIEQAKKILEDHPDIKFLVQTDEREFLETFMKEFKNSFYFTETPTINKSLTTLQYVIDKPRLQVATQYYVASINIMSRCKYILTTSGNGELWIALYRGHGEGIKQYLNDRYL